MKFQVHETLRSTERKKRKTHTHILPVLIFYTISQPCIIIDKNKTISYVCFIALPEFKKIFKNMLLVN